jgi:hypothetical protein
MIKVKEGDLDKLGLLFERYKKPLFGFFYGLTKDAQNSAKTWFRMCFSGS